DPRVISRVETVDRGLNPSHRILVRRWAVENERGGEICTVACETERLAASPAKAADEELAIRSRNLLRIVRCGIQIRRHLIRIQVAYRFHRLTLRKIAAPAPVRPHA